MSTLRAQVTIPMVSNLPEDAVVNRWHFNTGTTPSIQADRDAISNALALFYQAIDSWFSPLVASQATIDFYDMGDPQPRVPVSSGTIGLVPGGSVPLPHEVAMVLSYQATAESGVAQARRRNRVFLGPLGSGALGISTTTDRPDPGLISDITAAASDLLTASESAVNWAWVVRSETTGAVAVVDNGWVDDAWDTQRRRGHAATARTTF